LGRSEAGPGRLGSTRALPNLTRAGPTALSERRWAVEGRPLDRRHASSHGGSCVPVGSRDSRGRLAGIPPWGLQGDCRVVDVRTARWRVPGDDGPVRAPRPVGARRVVRDMCGVRARRAVRAFRASCALRTSRAPVGRATDVHVSGATASCWSTTCPWSPPRGVLETVVLPAQVDQVVVGGGSSVCPVLDVVDVAALGTTRAPWEAVGLVTDLQP